MVVYAGKLIELVDQIFIAWTKAAASAATAGDHTSLAGNAFVAVALQTRTHPNQMGCLSSTLELSDLPNQIFPQIQIYGDLDNERTDLIHTPIGL